MSKPKQPTPRIVVINPNTPEDFLKMSDWFLATSIMNATNHPKNAGKSVREIFGLDDEILSAPA
jgi:hypothetical protein